MAINNPEWRYAWPEGPEATLLFKYVAHFYRLSIEDELNYPFEGEADIKPTPELDRRVKRAIENAQRKVAWTSRKPVIKKAGIVAAIVILFVTALPTLLFAVSPEFRETVYKYIIDWRQGYADVNITAGLPAEQTFPKYYVLM